MKLKSIPLLLLPAAFMVLVACGGDTASPLPTYTSVLSTATQVPPTPTAVDYDWDGQPYVALGSGDLFEINTVWCMVSNVSDVAAISIGDKIEVQGTFSEWDGFDVVLKPCSI